jgi:phosphomannomutase
MDRELLDFEAVVMNMTVEPVENTEADLSPEGVYNQLTKKMNLGQMNAIAHSLYVSDEDSAKTALSMSLQARKLRQQLDESRKEIVKPHFDYQKAINKIVKDLEGKLEQIEQGLKEKIEGWNQERKDLPFGNITSLEIKVEDGLLYTQKKWDYSIDNSALVPVEYMSIDEKKIKEAVANGIRNIPGVQIFEKEELVMRVKN